ncbi:MAG: hypothetical protein ACNA8W_01550 [Bradymonadaceae bacterium]
MQGPRGKFAGAFLAVSIALMLTMVPSHVHGESLPDDFLGEAGEDGVEWLVIELNLGRHKLSEAIAVVWHPETAQILLPLGEFSELIEFPITVDLDDLQANGWFLRANQSVEVDFQIGAAQINGRAFPVTSDDWQAEPDDIYVSTKLLEEWFPLRFGVDLRNLRLVIDPLEPLPLQRRLEREARLARMKPTMIQEGPRYELVDVPYRFASVPVHDVRLEAALPPDRAYRQGMAGRRLIGQGNRYDLRGAGDLFWMTGRWHLAGSDINPLSMARMRLERKSPQAELLGPLGLTDISVGDIQSPASGVVARGHAARGVSLSSFPITRPEQFDRTTLQGELESGWEVELYRNGEFVGVAAANEAGTFSFDELPLVFGWNEVRLVYFGPYGEEREEFHHYLIGPGMIRPGEGHGRVVVQQQDLGLLPWSGHSAPTQRSGQPRATAHYEHGLTQRLSTGARLVTVPMWDGEQRYYGTLGLRTVWNRLYLAADGLADIGRGWGTQGHLHTRLGEVNLVAEHVELFKDFRSEEVGHGPAALRGRSRLRINGQVPGIRIPYGLTLEHRRFRETSSDTRLTGRHSLRILRLNLSHQQDLNWSGDELRSLTGTSTARMRWRRVSPRVEASYDYWPDPTLRYLAGVVDHYLARNLTSHFGVYNHFAAREGVTLRAGLSGRRPEAGWGFHVGWGPVAGASAGVSLTMGVGKNPHTGAWETTSDTLTNGGSVQPRVFWDHTGSGTFEDGDEPIEGATFRVNNVRRRSTPGAPAATTRDGAVYLDKLHAAQFTDVSVDPPSLEDPYALPASPGLSVVPRPGTVAHLDFPIILTGEVDGTAYLDRGDGPAIFPGACIALTPHGADEPLHTTTAAYDGFYYFPLVVPGDYHVSFCPNARSFAASALIAITVGPGGDVVDDVDIVALGRKARP